MTRLIVTLAIIVAVVVIILGMAGVLHVQNTDDKAGITVDKKELREKTHSAVEKTKGAAVEVLDKARRAVDESRERPHDAPAYDRRPPAVEPGKGAPAPAPSNGNPPRSA